VGLIRLWLYEGAALVADSGTIIDDGPESLRGGRLGVYCDSQEQITWLVFSYSCFLCLVFVIFGFKLWENFIFPPKFKLDICSSLYF
jgi:hypothetical protein